MSEEQRTVAVLGLWHQGVVGAACLAEAGVQVKAWDPDPERVRMLSTGKAPLYEPGLDDLLQEQLATGRLVFTPDLLDAVQGTRDLMLMFDTPVDEDDRADLSVVLETVEQLAPGAERDTVLLVTAQVPVGTCDRLRDLLLEHAPHDEVDVAYSPENLRLGQAIERFQHPRLPVVGADLEPTRLRAAAMLNVADTEFRGVNLRTAEMIKHALNSFLAASVGFANELGRLCDEVGADGKEVAEILRLEDRIGARAMLFPGMAFSGGTLARDVQTLRQLGIARDVETPFLDGLWESNCNHNAFILHKLRQHLDTLDGVPVTLYGLTYKPGTSTLRRSAALEVAAELTRAGADVRAHDPKADREELLQYSDFTFFEDPYAAAAGSRAAIFVTPWPEYRELDFPRLAELMEQHVVIDAQNALPEEQVRDAGFHVDGMGRGGAGAV